MNFTTGDQFLAWRDKRLAFIGMSGVGKSTLAGYLNPDQWVTFCTDYALADGPLRPQLEAFAGKDFPVGPHDISVLSAYVGKLGDPGLGGLPLNEFRRRQREHGIAERQTFEDLLTRLESHQGPALIDAGGSLVEILDFQAADPLRARLSEQVFFIYIETDEVQTGELIDRQLKAPKPMFYCQKFLDHMIEQFGTPLDQADPNAFIAYIFPHLIAHRRPRYAALADGGGVRVPLSQANQVRSDQDLLTLIAEHIDHAH